ncbi:MAG: hemerythrin domain-containing protein [Burkholderiaceae bacterium]
MADLIAQWQSEHANFSRLLDVLDEQMSAFHEGEVPLFGLMLDIVSYLREFSDALHHPREDATFARLVIRDPALCLPVNRLLQEHRAIAVAGEELVARLNEAVIGNVTSRATVEAAAALYLSYYRHHLAAEDREVLPRVAGLLTPEDWSIVASAVAPVPDPLFGDAPHEAEAYSAYSELREFLAARASAA